MEFDNKSFWKFTTALGRKLSYGRLFFYKIISDSVASLASGARGLLHTGFGSSVEGRTVQKKITILFLLLSPVHRSELTRTSY